MSQSTQSAGLIEFRCPTCNRGFSVPANFAGRRAKCKSCGGEITVPQPPKISVALAMPAPVRLSPRARRLAAEAEQMSRAFRDCEWIKIRSTTGDPPDIYQIDYAVKSLEPGKSPNKPIPRDSHTVEIQLTSEYPRTKPLCRMLTPIFHPNIDTATICVGDHWTAGERLVDLVVRIGEMLSYQAYNIRSPLDAEAAMWADLNKASLPLDTRNMNPPELA